MSLSPGEVPMLHAVVCFTASLVFVGLCTAANATCGTRGGPGYRAPDGHCVGWAERSLVRRARCTPLKSSKNSKANRIETGETSGGIRRNLFGGSRRKIAKKIANHRPS